MRSQPVGQFQIREGTTGGIAFRIGSGAAQNLFGLGIDTAGAAQSNTISVGRDNTNVTLDVQGSIVVDGTTAHADYVFEPDYKLNSIEDQAAFMWQQKHLPALPKAPEGLKGPVNLISHQMGILEELEKAHIYISRLNDTVKDLQARLRQLEASAK